MQVISSSRRTLWCEAVGEPAATVTSGEVFSIQSTSFTEGYEFETLSSLSLSQAVAPLTGPIIVEDAQPGDVLRIDVLDLKLDRDFGCVLLLPGRGVFPDAVPALIAYAVRVDDYSVHFGHELTIPTRKMLGKVAVAPAGERVSSSLPGSHGGNMDNNDIGIGASVYLPVFVAGAYLGMGDAHAVQGDGEIGISAVEVEMTSVVRVTVIKDFALRTPAIRSGGYVATMGTGPTLDSAAGEALREMRSLIEDQLRLSRQESIMFMSLACDLHVTQMVNTVQGVKAKVPERYIKLP